MYDRLLEQRDRLLEGYERAEEIGDKEQMKEISQKLGEFSDLIATELF